MKKLTILVALLMCVTIGGVYATWTYSSSSITPLTGVSAPKEMGEVTFEGASGAYHADTNTLKLVVEPKEDTQHTTNLTFTGELVIKFTPSDTISSGPLAKALNAVITISGIDIETTKYKETQIYTLVSDFKIQLNSESWTKEDGNYFYTLKASALADAISMAEFDLGSYDEFLDFQAKQASALFKININPAA